MADSERDLIGEDWGSSLVKEEAVLSVSTSSSNPPVQEAIDPGSLHNHGEALGDSAAIDVPTISNNDTLSREVNLSTIKNDDQVSDQGKIPVKVSEKLAIGVCSGASVTSTHGGIPPGCHATDVSCISEGLKNMEFPIPTGMDCKGKKETESGDDVHPDSRPTPPELNRKSSSESAPTSKQKQKQKQKAEPQGDSEAHIPHSSPTISGPSNSESPGTEAPAFRPLVYGEPGWEKSADRPPQKLPIRFKDAVGRQFVFPWEKVKTWPGMERLIRSSFAHVDGLEAHVNAGHYDLLACIPQPTGLGSGMAPPGGSIQPSSSMPTPAETDSSPGITTPDLLLPAGAFPFLPSRDSAVIILPELWEDLIEPGAAVLMAMWPMELPPPPPPPLPLPQHAMPPNPPMLPGFIGLAGTGHGRGRGAGRGMVPGMPPLRPPGWMVELPKPKGKTRKRQYGQ